MNDSSINLNYEIIKHGKIPHMQEGGEEIDIEASILSLYLDRRYYEQRNFNAFLEKIIERRGF